MKKLLAKWPLLFLLAAVTVSFAFASARETKTTDTYYYRYIGDSVDPSVDMDPYKDPENWVLSSAQESTCSNTGNITCKVAVPEATIEDFVLTLSDESSLRLHEESTRN
jgi:hypothetical protein